MQKKEFCENAELKICNNETMQSGFYNILQNY